MKVKIVRVSYPEYISRIDSETGLTTFVNFLSTNGHQLRGIYADPSKTEILVPWDSVHAASGLTWGVPPEEIEV